MRRVQPLEKLRPQGIDTEKLIHGPELDRLPAQFSSREWKTGGEGGIRTHDTLARIPVFETGPFNHSGTSPLLPTDITLAAKPEPVLAPAGPRALTCPLEMPRSRLAYAATSRPFTIASLALRKPKNAGLLSRPAHSTPLAPLHYFQRTSLLQRNRTRSSVKARFYQRAPGAPSSPR